MVLSHHASLRVDGKVVAERRRGSAQEAVHDGGLDRVHVDGLDLLRRHRENPGQNATGHLGMRKWDRVRLIIVGLKANLSGVWVSTVDFESGGWWFEFKSSHKI
jgi:hypothetical protein